ncbi:TetR/AcrR family transcriptional regulator [Mycoplasmatota bacterium WC30]
MNRREEILDALIEIFSSNGINNNFTMKELAERVSIGKSTIYEYFDTKDELLQQAVCRIVETSIKQIYSTKISEDDDFETSFKKELHFLFNLSLSSSNVFNMININFENSMPMEHKHEISSQINQVRDHYNKRFNDLFQKGIEEKVIKAENILTKNLMISSLVVGSIIRIANSGIKLSKNELTDYINAVYITVLRIAN